MSYSAHARTTHRQQRDISDLPEKPELSSHELILHKAIRAAVLNAYVGRLDKAQIAAVVERTMKDYAFQAQIRP